MLRRIAVCPYARRCWYLIRPPYQAVARARPWTLQSLRALSGFYWLSPFLGSGKPGFLALFLQLQQHRTSNARASHRLGSSAQPSTYHVDALSLRAILSSLNAVFLRSRNFTRRRRAGTILEPPSAMFSQAIASSLLELASKQAHSPASRPAPPVLTSCPAEREEEDPDGRPAADCLATDAQQARADSLLQLRTRRSKSKTRRGPSSS